MKKNESTTSLSRCGNNNSGLSVAAINAYMKAMSAGYPKGKAEKKDLKEGCLPEKIDSSGKVYVYDTLRSTNDTAKELALKGAENGTVVLAEEQTGGKGRLGRSFYSPLGRGIYMSVILRDEKYQSEKSACGAALGLREKKKSGDIMAVLRENLGPLNITAAAAVAVCRAISEVCGAECSIKWVNDVYLCGKKICGILTEAQASAGSGMIDSLVVGIGINCIGMEEDFPPELRKRAGTIAASASIGRNKLAAAVVCELLHCAYGGGSDPQKTDVLDEYRRRSMLIGEEIYIFRNACGGKGAGLDENGQPLTGIPAKAIGISDEGGLIVLYEDGKKDVLTDGEVSVRLKMQN